jgi:hypothetical protein
MTGNNGKGIIVQERDRHLLAELAIMRVVDREQAKRVAGFNSTTRANCRLLALTRAGLLRRFFQGTVGGARKALYALSPKGAELAAVPYRGPRRRNDETLITDFFVMHQLRVNEVYITLKYAPIPVPHTAFTRWVAFHEPLDPSVSLIPDGYVALTSPSGTLAAFVEVDLGHESRSVWRGKVQAYLKYAVSGRFTEEFRERQFRVLVIADSPRRIASLRVATASITEKIFWFSTFGAIGGDGFWSPIWQRPKNDTPMPLIEISS